MNDAETIAWLQNENERLRKRAGLMHALLNSKLDAALRDTIEQVAKDAARNV